MNWLHQAGSVVKAGRYPILVDACEPANFSAWAVKARVLVGDNPVSP